MSIANLSLVFGPTLMTVDAQARLAATLSAIRSFKGSFFGVCTHGPRRRRPGVSQAWVASIDALT